jgi:hypothetical protein
VRIGLGLSRHQQAEGSEEGGRGVYIIHKTMKSFGNGKNE